MATAYADAVVYYTRWTEKTHCQCTTGLTVKKKGRQVHVRERRTYLYSSAPMMPFKRADARQKLNVWQNSSLLLAALITFLLALTRDDLTQHHHTITIHESNTGQALAILERVAHKWLLRLEAALRHLV